MAVLLALIMAGLQAMPPVLTGYRERGILRRMSATPVRPSALLAAQIVLHGAAALGSARARHSPSAGSPSACALPGQAVGYALALLLAVACALALGATICALSRTTKVATAVGSVVFFPMMFTRRGLGARPDHAGRCSRRIVEFTPFGAASQALDQAASRGLAGLGAPRRPGGVDRGCWARRRPALGSGGSDDDA